MPMSERQHFNRQMIRKDEAIIKLKQAGASWNDLMRWGRVAISPGVYVMYSTMTNRFAVVDCTGEYLPDESDDADSEGEPAPTAASRPEIDDLRERFTIAAHQDMRDNRAQIAKLRATLLAV